MKDFGKLLLVLGGMAYLPSLVGYEWILSSWLGAMQEPVGISAMVVGGLLFGASKLAEFRNASPVAPPTGMGADASEAGGAGGMTPSDPQG